MDENHSISIEYSLTRSEIVRGFWAGVWMSARFRTTIVAYSAAMGLIALAASGAFSRRLTYGDLIAAVLWATGALIFMQLWLFLRGKTAKRTLAVSPEGISTQIGKLKGFVPWRRVKIIKNVGAYILVASRTGNCFLVPTRAFTSPEQQALFLSDLEHWRRAGNR